MVCSDFEWVGFGMCRMLRNKIKLKTTDYSFTLLAKNGQDHSYAHLFQNQTILNLNIKTFGIQMVFSLKGSDFKPHYKVFYS